MTPTTTTPQEQQLVAFGLAGETYAVPVARVQEIIRACDATELPRTADFLRGVINLRGRILPVIDLRTRLRLPPAPAGPASRILVVETDQGVAGLMVDSVSEVLRLPESHIEPSSHLAGTVDPALILGVGRRGDHLVILMDVDRILEIDD